MAKSVYVTAFGRESSKSLVSLGVVNLLSSRIARVGQLLEMLTTAGFNINDPGEPVIAAEANWWPNETVWEITELDDGLEAGTYYVAAYLDGNTNEQFDGDDPFGIMGGENPTPITVSDGSDFLDLSVTASDVVIPDKSSTSWSQKGAGAEGKESLRRLVELFEKSGR